MRWRRGCCQYIWVSLARETMAEGRWEVPSYMWLSRRQRFFVICSRDFRNRCLLKAKTESSHSKRVGKMGSSAPRILEIYKTANDREADKLPFSILTIIQQATRQTLTRSANTCRSCFSQIIEIRPISGRWSRFRIFIRLYKNCHSLLISFRAGE